ncbi:class I SAM-dependent methyltransferase [Mariprofundus erugo]|uniref:Class I SAM-dependent methyltransferase n=2 Tax=Mariprofundus erugo TaxID=2528639 RepID=A0A5R9GTT9_9PROT|nr:class I SAM-dependent methyltransferase [Mariprofundus erugo]TLS66664.1 class I SAM-dependent methyltransferase [Mariprofundus erugo]TLS74533.1 class I SAM-dependent methyltransferase [Mariprofundus erugo]
MNAHERQRMVARHRDSARVHGYSTDALFWTSRGLQKQLFTVLAEVGVAAGDSVLDVGCGFGDLYSWLRGRKLTVEYTGIDISPDILEIGMRMNPGLNLLCGELFDFDWPQASFDWLLLSGTLNWQLHDDGAYMRRLVSRMYALCRHGVAFNMLDARKIDAELLGEMRAYEPDDVLSFCRRLSPDCHCRTDYLPDDFTIYMLKR